MQTDATFLPRRYILGRKIGAGGFGEVYTATDRLTGEQLAVKIYRFQAHDVLCPALKVHAVHHPNVIPVLDAGEYMGRSYLVMPLIAGHTLADHLVDRTLTPRAAIDLLEGIASGLDELHQAGIVHMDIKPSNIMVTDEPTTRAILLDFGSMPTVDADITGRFVGTPAYAAPEQISRRRFNGAAADIYSLSAVLAECITAAPLFSRPTYDETVRAHLERTEQLVEPDNLVVRALIPVLERGLALDPERRYGTASELIDAARTALSEIPPELLDQPIAQSRSHEPAPTTVRS